MAGLDSGRLRRLPRLPGRRPRRAAPAPSSPSRARRRAGRRPGSGRSSGLFGIRSRSRDPLVLGERGDDHLGGVGPRAGRRASRSARSKGPTPSGSRRATGSCSTAGRWSSAGSRARPSTPGRPAASRACRAGRATASRSRPSWRSTSAEFRDDAGAAARRRPVGPPRLALRGARARPRGRRRAGRPVRGAGAAQRGPGAGRRCSSRSRPATTGWLYTFHAPLSRSACEALGRAIAARLGRRFGRDLALTVADLGWSIRLPEGARRRSPSDLAALLDPEGFADDVLEGLDRGDLLARRFRHVAATALMVLRPRRRARRGSAACSG